MKREILFRAWSEFPKYQVGTDGSVWSLDYNHTGKRNKLKQTINSEGYAYVFLVVGGKRYKRLVHRMVAMSFIYNPENKPHVNHLNGIRDHNALENLEWATAKENTIHGYRSNGRKQTEHQKNLARERFQGVNNPKSKVNEATVISIRRLRLKGTPLKDIAERHSLSVSQVSAIANNKFWKNGI